jgi:hypothetical protein
MPFALGATAVGMAAARVAESKAAGKEFGREGVTLQQFKLALSKTGGLRSARLVSHIVAIMLQETTKSKSFF